LTIKYPTDILQDFFHAYQANAKAQQQKKKNSMSLFGAPDCFPPVLGKTACSLPPLCVCVCVCVFLCSFRAANLQPSNLLAATSATSSNSGGSNGQTQFRTAPALGGGMSANAAVAAVVNRPS
jgi:hypothetical protein